MCLYEKLATYGRYEELLLLDAYGFKCGLRKHHSDEVFHIFCSNRILVCSSKIIPSRILETSLMLTLMQSHTAISFILDALATCQGLILKLV